MNYLYALINEAMERAVVLRDGRMKLPLDYQQLSGLANRCNMLLDQNVANLRELKTKLIRGDVSEREGWRELRDAIRNVEWIEKYGIPSLYYPSKEVGFLNSLMFKIVNETNLPVESPAVSCLSTNYYFTASLVNVIFVPLSEPDFMLHLPDLYHELGHYVSGIMKTNSRLDPLGKSYRESFSIITAYYNELLRQKIRESAPRDIIYLIRHIHSQWKDWIEEFFCDLLAVSLIGPAYAWAHLHLSAKISENIYQLSVVGRQTHPSDEARMRLLLTALHLLKFDRQANQIESQWRTVMQPYGSATDEFQYAYPSLIMEEVIEKIIETIRDCGMNLAESTDWTKGNDIRDLLNLAWEKFWILDPAEFRVWEKTTMTRLQERLLILNH